MGLIPERDPSIPQNPYDPNKPNPGIQEILRQEEFCEPKDWGRALAAISESHGQVFENNEWVLDVPHSQATWEGDGA